MGMCTKKTSNLEELGRGLGVREGDDGELGLVLALGVLRGEDGRDLEVTSGRLLWRIKSELSEHPPET